MLSKQERRHQRDFDFWAGRDGWGLPGGFELFVALLAMPGAARAYSPRIRPRQPPWPLTPSRGEAIIFTV